MLAGFWFPHNDGYDTETYKTPAQVVQHVQLAQSYGTTGLTLFDDRPLRASAELQAALAAAW